MAAGASVWSSTPASTCRASAQRCLRVDLQADLCSRPDRPASGSAQLAPMAGYRVQHQGLLLTRTGSPAIDVPFGVDRGNQPGNCPNARARQHPQSQEVSPRMSSLSLATLSRIGAGALSLTPRSPPTVERQTRRCDVGRNMGATCRSELPPTLRPDQREHSNSRRQCMQVFDCA